MKVFFVFVKLLLTRIVIHQEFFLLFLFRDVLWFQLELNVAELAELTILLEHLLLLTAEGLVQSEIHHVAAVPLDSVWQVIHTELSLIRLGHPRRKLRKAVIWCFLKLGKILVLIVDALLRRKLLLGAYRKVRMMVVIVESDMVIVTFLFLGFREWTGKLIARLPFWRHLPLGASTPNSDPCHLSPTSIVAHSACKHFALLLHQYPAVSVLDYALSVIPGCLNCMIASQGRMWLDPIVFLRIMEVVRVSELCHFPVDSNVPLPPQW